MSRRARISLTVAAVAFTLVVGAGAARILSATTAERNAVTDAIKAQPRAQGDFTLLRFDPGTSFGPTGQTGTARVAWSVRRGRTIVQCVEVVRGGSVVSGFDVRVGRVREPIGLEDGC